MKIANRLLELRSATGKSQQQVVDEITAMLGGRRPFNRTMLSHWEQDNHQPGQKNLVVLCRYYQVTPGEILQLQEDGAPVPA